MAQTRMWTGALLGTALCTQVTNLILGGPHPPAVAHVTQTLPDGTEVKYDRVCTYSGIVLASP